MDVLLLPCRPPAWMLKLEDFGSTAPVRQGMEPVCGRVESRVADLEKVSV